MTESAPDPHQFYTEKVPADFNRLLEEQEALGEEGARVLAGMKAVRETIRVDIEDAGATFFLNIESGHMTPGDSPARPPFLTLIQNRAAFERLAREASDSAMALLGGLSGLAGEMKLTQQRIQNLEAVKGKVHFEVTGDDGFALCTHFGGGAIPEEPDAVIRVAPDAYRDLRSGTLNPQDAFMNGKIEVEGDMQMTMQLALAAIAPD